MASSGAQTLSALFKGASLDDNEEILRSTANALKKDKADLAALHVKVVALTKLDRYEEALDVLEQAGDALKKHARLEWAYALYKCGRLEEAREVASAGPRSQGLQHVEAQAAYRAEDFARAADLYEELARRGGATESDLRINGSATDAQLVWAGQSHLMRRTKPDRADLEQFETTFNAACRYIAQGELKQAELLLKRTRDLCSASDELSDEEKKAELLPITVQQVFVLFQLGKAEEAEQLCASISVMDISDQATRHVAQANSLLVSSQALNPYLAQRLFRSTASIPRHNIPFNYQSSALNRNSLTIELLAQKRAGVVHSTMSRLSKEPEGSISADVTSAGVFNAAAHAHNKSGKAALREILPLLEKRPNDVGLLLTIVQLYVLTNNVDTATALLESFLSRLEGSTSVADQETRFAPGLVALLVSLYMQQSRTANTRAELAKAAKYWRHKSRAPHSSELLKVAGASLLGGASLADYEAARELFGTLLEQSPGDAGAIAGAVASTLDNASDSQLNKRAESLPTIDKLTAGIDVDALEEAGVAQAPLRNSGQATKKRSAADALLKPTKKRKLRKSKTPKEYDPNKKPDPERWLALRDRSNWRPKGKKKGRAAGMVTQGGMVSEDSRPGTPNQQHLQQQQQKPAGGAAKNKNKKKGKK